jgi:2-oxoacid:acceptor oxidoreductase gamma subunit (pyruvate/2-ketoisovalerate family)
MKKGSFMIGIRFHGRGGQGAVVASKILAQAYFRRNYFVQSFPSFGMERRGAAVAAYVRVDSTPILERGEIKAPRWVIVLDRNLLGMVDVTEGILPGGTLLVNFPGSAEDLGLHGPFHIATVDAGRIALKYGLGSKTAPIVNTVILGAFTRLEPQLKLADVISAIREGVPGNPEENAAAAREAYEDMRLPSGDSYA